MRTSLDRVEITHAHHTFCASDWSWLNPRTQVNELLLWVIVEGRGTLETADGAHRLRGGDCYLMRMKNHYHGRHDPRTPLVVLWAIYHYLDENGRIVPITDAVEDELPSLHRRLGDLAFVSRLYDRAIDAFLAGSHADASRWMSATLLEVDRQDRRPALSGLEKEQVEAVEALCERIQNIPARPWRVEDMARGMHCSPDHFTRVFRGVKGVTPREFLVQTRIDAARSLLTVSSHSITRIADMLGYGDVYHFSKQFRTKVGMSPSEYRKRE